MNHAHTNTGRTITDNPSSRTSDYSGSSSCISFGNDDPSYVSRNKLNARTINRIDCSVTVGYGGTT